MTEYEDVGWFEVIGATFVGIVIGFALAGPPGTTDNPEQNDTVVKEVCVESHYEYAHSFSEGFPNLDELNESFAFSKSNYTDIDGGIYYRINSTQLATDEAKLVYERVEICDKKENRTISGDTE